MPTSTPKPSSSRRRPASARGSSTRKKDRTSPIWGSLSDFAKFFEATTGNPLDPFQFKILHEVWDGLRTLLVLIPRGNGKTTLFAVLALWHLLIRDRAKVYLAASSRDQAGIALDTALEIVQSDPRLQKLIKPLPGYKMLQRRDRPGFIKILSSDADRAMGAQPTLVLVDELHAHKNDKLYIALKTAMGKNMDAQLVTISTAGWDDEGALGLMRDAALGLDDCQKFPKERLTVARNPESNFAMLEWALWPEDDDSDPKAYKRANPATFVKEDFLREQLAAPDLHHLEVMRFHGNVWTAVAESWLPPGAWEACCDADAAIPEGSDVAVGVDVGRKHDHTAVVALYRRADGRVVVDATVFVPPEDGTSLDLDLVERHLRDMAGRFNVLGVVYDPWSFERSAQMLADEGLTMIEHPQSPERMHKSSSLIYEAVMNKTIAHNGDRALAAHVAAGSSKDTERGWRLVKNPKLKKPIDALIAMTIGFSLVSEPPVGGGFEW